MGYNRYQRLKYYDYYFFFSKKICNLWYNIRAAYSIVSEISGDQAETNAKQLWNLILSQISMAFVFSTFLIKVFHFKHIIHIDDFATYIVIIFCKCGTGGTSCFVRYLYTSGERYGHLRVCSNPCFPRIYSFVCLILLLNYFCSVYNMILDFLDNLFWIWYFIVAVLLLCTMYN